MKTMYEQPELEIIKFQMEDIMDASAPVGDEDELPQVGA